VLGESAKGRRVRGTCPQKPTDLLADTPILPGGHNAYNNTRSFVVTSFYNLHASYRMTILNFEAAVLW